MLMIPGLCKRRAHMCEEALTSAFLADNPSNPKYHRWRLSLGSPQGGLCAVYIC